MATKTSAQKQKEIEAYWARRNEELEREWHRKCRQEIEKELADYYRQALSHIDDDIAKLYARFADQNGMDMAAAQRMLQGDEFRVWRMDIAEYVQQIATTGDKELLRELNVLAMRSRITRLDKLKGDTLVELSKLTKKAEDAIGRFLPSAYKDFYYRGLYEIGKQAGIGVTVNRLDKEKLEAVTRTPWSGKNYSDRIWHNNAELGRTIEQTMLTAMHRGSSLNDLSRYVAGRMNVGIHNAQRLVQTELNYVQNRAALDSIKDAGMRYYRFIATLDNRTSQICREHDGMVFAVDDADAGYNMPPLHPRCRSTISGSLRGLADKPIGTRIARDPEKGKTVRYVPAGMKYQEWKAVYVDKEMSLDTWKQAHTSSIIKAEETVTFTPDMFGSGFTSNKAEAARTQILCDYLNSVEGVDPDISSLYSKLSEFQQDKPTNIIHRVNKGQERGYCSWDGREVCIPKITKEYAGGKATTITHELGHWLDNYFEKGKGWFTETNKALSEAISKCEIQESSAIPKEILDLSAELRKFDGTLRQEINDRYLAEKNKVIAEKGGYTWAKQSKRIWQKLLAERDSRLREWKPAYTSLEDIVDALSKGKATNTWHSVNYGHGLGYYARVGTTAEEIFANYCAINMTNPEVAKMLKKYFPELDEALRGVIRDMKKGMKKP